MRIMWGVIMCVAIVVALSAARPVIGQVGEKSKTQVLPIPTKLEANPEGVLRAIKECAVAYVDAGPIKVGITRDAALSMLKDTLERAGIRLLTDAEVAEGRRRGGWYPATVLVSIEASEGGAIDGHAVYSIVVNLIDFAVLPRDSSSLFQVVSFQRSFVGVAPIAHLDQAAKPQLDALLQMFSEACVASKK